MTVSKLAAATWPLGKMPNGGNRWGPRMGTRVDRFIVHHAAARTPDLKAAFVAPGRELSAHYGIAEDGTIAAILQEEERPFTSSSSLADRRAVTVEVANSATGDASGWPVSEASFRALAALIADVATRYGFPIDRTHIIGHREVLPLFGQGIATVCPGGLWPRMGELVGLARKFQAVGSEPSAPIDAPAAEPDTRTREVTMLVVQAPKATYTLGIEFIRHEVDGKSGAYLASIYNPGGGIVVANQMQFLALLDANGIPRDVPDAVAGGKSWSRAIGVRDVRAEKV